MRGIKFRALALYDEKKWIHGLVYKSGSEGQWTEIQHEDGSSVIVDLETLGQFTGLKDKNGTEIYAGDIVYQEYYDEQALEIGGFTGVVKQFEGAWWISNNFNHAERLWSELNENKVLGNMYDNPELWEVSK